MRPALLLLLGLLSTACAPMVPNRAVVFAPLSGTVVIQLKLDGEPGTRAEFMLDGAPVGTDADPSDGYALPIDTTAFRNGTHVLRSRILRDSGLLVTDQTHALLFRNDGAD